MKFIFSLTCFIESLVNKEEILYSVSFQLLSHVWLFVTPWTAAHQASLSITNSRSPPKPMSIEGHPTISSSVIPFSSCPQSFPASLSFQMSQLFLSGGQNIGVSASTSVLPMNNQDWSRLERTGWSSLQSKGLSRVFSNTTVQKHQFFGAQLFYSPNLISIQFSSVTQSCSTLWDHNMSGLHVHHQLPEFTQTHAHWVGDAI